MATVRFNAATLITKTRAAAEFGLARGALYLADRMREVLAPRGGRFSSSPAGTPPHRQRGGLLGSIVPARMGKLKHAAGSNFSGKSNYGLFQEKGATIRAKSGKYIAVPVNPAAKKLRESHANLRTSGVKMRFFNAPNGLFMVGTSNVAATIYQRGANGRKRSVSVGGEPVFKLVRSVRLKPRPWCAPTFRKHKRAVFAEFRTHAAQRFASSVKGGTLK